MHQLSTRRAQVDGVSAPANDLSAPVNVLSTPAVAVNTLADTRIGTAVKLKIAGLGRRVNDNEILKSVIMKICANQYFKSTEIARILLKLGVI